MKTLSMRLYAKTVAIFPAIILCAVFSQAQDITGQWNGVLSVQGTNLRLVFHVENLPFIHRDPFDRMLVAAAKAEGMTILTADENIHKYDVPSGK